MKPLGCLRGCLRGFFATRRIHLCVPMKQP
ncbi:hypothetical protein ORF017 [Yersinia phage PYps49T]|nr:hypothetical protein ORF017 [Yersinia phage PYps49T]